MSTNAFITRSELSSTGSGMLDGHSVAVKDNISTEGVLTTCASKMLADYVPPYSATVVDRILNAGGTIIGKTNMDEFGMGSTTETSAYGPTENPTAPGRVPGGSSGGSAAAVAAGEADLALGSDTGGSIRCPAAFCGVVGLKPTYGLVSRYGLVAYANSLEQIGPMATDVKGVAQLLDVIAGVDERDATTKPSPETSSYQSALDEPVDDITIGIPNELLEGVDEPVLDGFEAGIARLEAAGAQTKSISISSLEPAVQAYYVIAVSEASSNLARFDGVRYGHHEETGGDWHAVYSNNRSTGFGDEVKRRILLGTFALSAGYQDRYYQQAQHARAWLQQELETVFESVDLLASPTMPVEPFPLGEAIEDPMTMYRADRNTVPVNLANTPAISVPVTGSSGLPVGLQLIGPANSERALFSAGEVVYS